MTREQIDQFLNSVLVKEKVALHQLVKEDDTTLVLSLPGKYQGYEFFKVDFKFNEDKTLNFNSIQVNTIDEDIIVYLDKKQIESSLSVDPSKVLYKEGKHDRNK